MKEQILAGIKLMREYTPPPHKLVALVHPAHAANAEHLLELRAMQANGLDVQVMERVNGPSVPLDQWLKQKGQP